MKKYRSGEVNILLIVVIVMSVLLAVLAGLGVWLYVQYSDQKTNVDGKINEAVALAKKEQAQQLEAKFVQREKEPNREFVGPDDYGRLSFMYPKTWSVYVAKDASNGGTYEAYLNPVLVPPVSSDQIFALRLLIEEKSFDTVLKTYESAIKKGDLRSSAITVGGTQATRLDGIVYKDMRGSIVLLKIRDKTATIRTDAETFKTDFDALIKTVKFNY
ncbi:hypothetical protein FWF48_02700 [Candidatus Saccharibacteria bacterium]|nr:hypothetical protein [Candidatus Saccharibacteria bacterium]